MLRVDVLRYDQILAHLDAHKHVRTMICVGRGDTVLGIVEEVGRGEKGVFSRLCKEERIKLIMPADEDESRYPHVSIGRDSFRGDVPCRAVCVGPCLYFQPVVKELLPW